MVKIIAPFLIKGTIGDMNFVVTADGNNYARLRREPPVSSLEFRTNPKYECIRNHGKEFGQCTKKSVLFRQLAVQFNRVAKEGSFAGRANKLLFEILQEDTSEERGKRTLSAALKTNKGKEALVEFESNKLRALQQVLKIKEEWHQESQTLTLTNFNPQNQLDWPDQATQVQLTIATANWDCENETFETNYSDTVVLDKDAATQTITLTTVSPQAKQLHLTYLCICFAKKDTFNYKLLHRKYNTATIIAQHTP
ncbi:hypothetical protein HNQ02_002311 [Flavobacterium sp. 7E]|uniref:hypothetical protein n=1 Tax=Flavobacterium sp. 7E TaxID=2735898 RepID=UPI001570CCAA|nr:hypothetical protein [Flavobacterium sp. 7E]NRS89382.1 hypothetical protein [Flavobacterium sp. 7E]